LIDSFKSAKIVLPNGLNHIESLKALATLFVKGKHDYHYEGGFLPRKMINVFPQPRKTFENIHELSLDEYQKGQLNLPTIAPFNKIDCEQYLYLSNILWKTKFSIDDAIPFRQKGKERYEVLIAGERRLRGWDHVRIEEFLKCLKCQEVWDEGCENCKKIWEKKHKKIPKGFCYIRHFGTKPGEPRELLEVRLCVGISPIEALFLQFSENTHMSVPACEEAQAYAQLFNLIRTVDATFTLSFFSQLVGRNPDTVRNAIKYTELPRSIQERVEKKDISYGIALELTRLQTQGLKEEELDRWATMAITGKYRVDDFRTVVTELIKNLTSGQTALFSTEQIKEMESQHFRIIVERHIIMAIWSWIHYFAKVLNLFTEGRLGKTDSPFSHRSPLKVFRKLIDLLENLFPHLQSLLPKKEVVRTKRVIKKTKKIVFKLEQQASD